MIDSDHNQAELLQELKQLRQRVSDLELALANCQPENNKQNQAEQSLRESELKQNTQLRELLISLALDFISFPNSEIDSHINKLLKQIGEFIGVDRSYINVYANNFETVTRA